ncbi:MAG: ABC transporter [Nocardioides sp.]|nr:ABC transporter [Nocardioides sp.]
MLRLDDVTLRYDDEPALDRVTLGVPDGAVVGVLGPSGCGKSTLLRVVAGLERPDTGRVRWDDRDLARVPTHKRGFALMFQDGQLFAHLTVAANVAYALKVARRRARVGRRGRAARVEELLALVGLEGFGHRLPASLSGGERQRVALARALAGSPRLLLLDEPLSALDTGLRERLAGDLGRILREAGTTTLVVTHDQEEAFALSDRLVLLRAGRVVQEGPAAEVWSGPADATTALFLGYARVLDGDPAVRLLRAADLEPGGAVALRRSALEVVDEGTSAPDPELLAGRVVEARATPDQVRLVAVVPGIGEVDAVAPPSSTIGPGARVVLRVEPSRVARVPVA